MTKEQALYSFYSQFLTAYEENTVPENATFPYLTYSVATDDFGGYSVALQRSLWYRDSSWRAINRKTSEISRALGYSGTVLKVDNGFIWLRKGQPFAQSMGDENDDLIRRKYLNLEADFITTD